MIKQIIAAAAITGFAFAASAQIQNDSTTVAQAPSRAAVVADLEIYRQSGLQFYDNLDGMDFSSKGYQDAKKRYEDLRKSPKYAELVRTYAARFGEAADTTKVSAVNAKPSNQ